jgi:type III restriction enzyme
MALNPDFPDSPYAIFNPEIRWFPADEALRELSFEKLMPPLVVEVDKENGKKDLELLDI